MMWKEFEELAGYEVSYEDYTNVIEPMYMAIPDCYSKQDFIKMIDKKRFALPTKAEMKRAMRKEANHLFEICGHCTDWESEERLENLARKYAERFYNYDRLNESNGVWYYLHKEYEYPAIQRGCTYPDTLRIMYKDGSCLEEVILYA